MRAVVYRAYGGPEVLGVEEVVVPAPGDDEVSIRVRAASVNKGDWHLMRGEPALIRLMSGLRRPKLAILGTDVAGTIEAVGAKVTAFEVGDEVFGDLSGSGFGTFAEYVCGRVDALAPKPAGVSFEEAAAVPSAAVTALQAVRDHARVSRGERVLVHGASGGVGTYAVQLAKHFGAEVTGVCRGDKTEAVRVLGADRAIDYTQQDFASEGEQYDAIVDAGAYRSIFDHRRALKPGGRYVLVGGSMRALMQAMTLGPIVSMIGGKTIGNFLVKPNRTDLEFLAGLLESGAVRPVIDRRYGLDDLPEAMRYFEGGGVTGKVVIAIDA